MAAPQGRCNPPITEEVSGLSVSAAASSTLSQFLPEVDEHFYRDLVVSMRNGVLAIDRNGTLVVVNDVACRILGLAADDQHLGAPLHRCPGAEARVRSGAFVRLRPESPSEPVRTETQAFGKGNGLHAVAGHEPVRRSDRRPCCSSRT